MADQLTVPPNLHGVRVINSPDVLKGIVIVRKMLGAYFADQAVRILQMDNIHLRFSVRHAASNLRHLPA